MSSAWSGELAEVMREYAPSECGPDGYPRAWHRLPEPWLLEWSSGIVESECTPGAVMGVKHVVRAEAGHRCIRCNHPYRPGLSARGEWTPCDGSCTHGGPIRVHGLNYEASKPAGVLAQELTVPVEAQWRILTVHHLRTGADAKRDPRWWNLAALCQRCHLTIQGKVQMDRVWPWEHTPWFRPHAAGFYAWRYLGEELTRAETMARLDELLALERQVSP